MRVVGIGLLHALRDDLWADADELIAGMVPLGAFLPDSVMEDILYAFLYLLTSPTLESLRKDDGSLDLEASPGLLQPFAADNNHLIGDSWNTLMDSLRI